MLFMKFINIKTNKKQISYDIFIKINLALAGVGQLVEQSPMLQKVASSFPG